MANLYLIFFAVGLLLFGAIVGYSILQKRRQQTPSREEYVDPLFAELEEQKGRKTQAVDTHDAGIEPASISSFESQEPRGSSAELESRTVALEPNTTANDSGITNAEAVQSKTVLNKSAPTDSKKAPSLKKPSSPSQPAPTIEEPNAPSLKDDSAADVTATSEAAATSKPKLDKESSMVLTELVARVKNPSPIEQQGLLSLFRKHDFKFHRKVHIYGLNELTEMWRDIEFELPSARFTELGISIQLADREGAMTKKELHDFQQMVLEFTNEYDAPFEFSMDIDEALTQAASLDQIGRRYDSMAVLNVVPRAKSGFRMADIESCARDLMMSTDKNGIFMKTKGHKTNLSILYRLACTDGSGHFGISSGAATPVHDLVVYMNVPATEDPEMVFQQMVKDANSLATWLDGKVVDRAGRVMTQRSYSMLMQQVSDIAFSMQQDGLTPGDAISKKLF